MMVGRVGSVLAKHVPIKAWRVYAASLPCFIMNQLDDCEAQCINDTRSINMTVRFAGDASYPDLRSPPKNCGS